MIAVPIVSCPPPLREQVRAAKAAGADLVELRVDCLLASAPDVSGDIENLLDARRELPLIITVRSVAEGGTWIGSEAERWDWIARLAGLRPDLLDIEYATWQTAGPHLRAAIGAFRGAGGRVIVSHHDLAGTPVDLDRVFAQLAAAPADIIKVVPTARDATDGCRVLVELARRGVGCQAGAPATIALAMGEAGLATRVLARKFGAYLTFAALAAERGSAPGQPTVDELRNVYRWAQIGPHTRVYGLIGWPTAHSLGPAVHNAALAAAGVDGVYLPFPVQPTEADFSAFMDVATRHAELDLAGLSVTLPHKEHALHWLDRRGDTVSELARRCGAVNTLIRPVDGRWSGDNTDVLGVLAALDTVPQLAGAGLRGRQAAVLGAGGAARAAVVALQERGAVVTVYNRTAARATRLAQELRCTWRPWTARHEDFSKPGRTHVLVNCTSVGLWPAQDESPVPEQVLQPGLVVFDTIYRPAETRLIRTARTRGCTVIPGAAMFIGQAAAQFARWHERAAPHEVLTAVFNTLSAPPK